VPTTGTVLATDLYQLTMAAGYHHRGFGESIATCELFVRRLPTTRRYLVALGIDQIASWIVDLRFTPEDVAFLKTLPALAGAMTPDLERLLLDFRFTGDVSAVEEGTLVFENEPLLRVRAPIIQAQLLETYALSTINHATMIGSKAARIVQAAAGRAVVEFGTRRTHPDAAIDAARAAYACGFSGTSNVEAARRFGIPVLGTAAHMWTMAHASEEEAFRGYFQVFPENSLLLIDTYDTSRGASRAIAVARDKLVGVRIDSGDLDALSRIVRRILDAEGAPQAKIVVSGDLHEHTIAALVAAGAPIDTFGVGTELVCSADAPSLGGVYKIVELEDANGKRPVAKFSEGKGTFPGPHQILRITDDAGAMQRDIVALEDEAPLPLAAGERSVALLSPIIAAGRRVRSASPLADVRARVTRGRDALPPILRDLAPRSPEGPRYSVTPSTRLRSLTEEVRKRFLEEGGQGS